jgi:hypothetical protein
MPTTSERDTVREMEAWATPRQNSLVTVAAGEDSGWAWVVAPRMGYPSPTLSIPYYARTRTAATHPTPRWRPYRRRGADSYPLPRCTVPWPASSDSLSVHVWGGFSPNFMWWLSQPSISKLYTYNPCSTLSQCLPSNSYWSPFKIELKFHPITLLLKIQSRDWLTARLWA